MDEAAYGEETLRINKEYAASYTRRKQAEELSRREWRLWWSREV